MPEVLSFTSRSDSHPPVGRSPMPLKVRHLAYKAGNTPILNGIDLDLDTNSLTVLMGPNGAGKSVLLRLIHGLLPPTFGDIHWNGLPLTRSIRKEQALVLQKPVLLRRSAASNLSFALGLRKFPHQRTTRVRKALEEAGLAHVANRPARVLSGGEQQRLALARALLLNPKVLMLDEPTANLDPASTLLIEQAIAKVRREGVKVVLITHDQHQARRLAEDVVFLHGGKVAEHTAADQFFDTPASAAAKAYLAGDLLI